MSPQLANLLAMVPKEKRVRFVQLLLQNTTGAFFRRADDKPMLQTIAETVWVCLEEADSLPARYKAPQ